MSTLSIYAKIFFLSLRGKEPIVELFFKNKKTLDVGCGQGDFLVKDLKNFTGVDINEELMEKARKRGATVTKASVDKLPFEDKSFEGVNCINVIEHLTPDAALAMLQEISRVLKPNGTFVLGTEWPTQRIWDTFSHIRPYSPRSIIKLMRHEHQETFETLSGFTIAHVLYKGRFFRNSILRGLFWIPAIIFPFARHDWIMVLTKNA